MKMCPQGPGPLFLSWQGRRPETNSRAVLAHADHHWAEGGEWSWLVNPVQLNGGIEQRVNKMALCLIRIQVGSPDWTNAEPPAA